MTDTFYPVKHWLVTLVLGSITTALFSYLIYGEGAGLLEIFPFLVLWGMVLSLPSLLLYYLLFIVWIKKMKSPMKQKLILNLIAIICMAISFMLLTDFDGSILLSFLTGYLVAIILSSLFLKIREQGQVPGKESKTT